MAFKKAPEQDTYSTVEFPIVKELFSRDEQSAKDNKFENVIIQSTINKVTGQHELEITKRGGYTQFMTTDMGFVGLHFVQEGASGNGTLYAVLATGDCVTIDISNSGTFGTVAATLFTFASGGAVGLSDTYDVKFADFRYDTGVQSVMVTDGSELYEIDVATNVETLVTDAQLPNFKAQTLECMDGYVFLGTSTGDIFNSDLNNPQSWTAGNFISTEMANDGVWTLNRINNYLVAQGGSSTEFFYNAGIATGSPLQRNTSLYKAIGLLNDRVARSGDKLYFYGNEANYAAGGVGVYELTLDNVRKVSNDAIEQKLMARHHGTATSNKNWRYKNVLGLTYHSATATPILCVNLGASGSPGPVVDGSNYWINLDNGTITTAVLHEGLGIAEGLTFANSTGVYSVFRCARHYTSASGGGGSHGELYYWDHQINTDNGTNFTFTIVTDLEDFDTINRKTMSRLVLVGEKPASTASVSVSWTDDDYQNFNTPISVDMFQDLPSIQRLGQFRRRALKITGTHALPFSLKRIEVDINKGNT